jgi:hypothetical protein
MSRDSRQSGGNPFSILQGQSLLGESFTAVKRLIEHIDAYNADAKPFVWTKSEVHQKQSWQSRC